MMDDRPGERFSQVYGVRGEPTADSARMRHRIGGAIASMPQLQNNLRGIVDKEIGVSAPAKQTWMSIVKEMALSDLLDLMTVAADYLKNWHGPVRDEWIRTVDRIFREENVHYRIEREGGVRFYIDEAFARSRASVIAALAEQRYANVLAEFEKGMGALAQAPPDGKGAARAVFTAIEGLFLIIFQDLRRLAAGDVSRLRPLIHKIYVGDRRAQETSEELLQSLRAWIDAAHGYRHEEGKPDTVAQPPLTLAVYLVSSGASHLRWIAELEAKALAQLSDEPK
jgi:hypothetical protein